MFPLEVTAESNPDQTITTAYQLTTTNPVYIMNWGKLTLANGGCLIAYNQALQISIDALYRTGNPPSPYSDINILGATGATGSTGGAGTTGTAGGPGTNGYCSSGGIAGPGGTNGNTGGAGIVGGTGGTGQSGKPSQSAVITIHSFGTTGTISVAGRSGTGGAGGTGGVGGRGGTGGSGGNGVTCACTGNGGGSGAPGGTGGAGGQGGIGGNAVNAAANVVIYVPQANASQIFPITNPVPPARADLEAVRPAAERAARKAPAENTTATGRLEGEAPRARRVGQEAAALSRVRRRRFRFSRCSSAAAVCVSSRLCVSRVVLRTDAESRRIC